MGWGTWVVSIVLLTGCIRSELVPCDNGLACPVGFVCDEIHTSCVTPEQVTSCADRPDLTRCLEDGVCRDGVCLTVGCGNSRVDPAEACDDGNLASADGCSADCSSDERCGNGTVDPINGEQCDDGGFLDHDGCTSRCALEQPVWTQLVQVPHPSLQHAAGAYDEARRRLVVFGGEDPNENRTTTTLEWDSVQRTWLARDLVVTPTPRHGAAMVFDRARGQMVLFGGADPAGIVGDTWTFDGESWKQVVTPIAPPRRVYHAMVYDARRDRVLMFGGRTSTSTYLGDLWAFDGTAWTELTPALSPAARERPALGYDPVRDQVVMTGGYTQAAQNDTWVFDGTAWAQRAPLPGPKLSPMLTFDPIRGAIVLNGGASSGASLMWTGSAWQSFGGPSPLGNRFYGVAYFDPDLGGIVGGLGNTSANGLDTLIPDLHLLVGTTWTALAAEPGPPPVSNAAMVYDAHRGKVVLFGGNDGTRDIDNTWELTGTTWKEILPASRPAARDTTGMVYDRRRERTVMWGGHASDLRVWEWDGAVWTSITPTGPQPGVRSQHKMVYDELSGMTLMFGGVEIGAALRSGDSWLWDGAAWMQLSGPAPSARNLYGFAYDPVRHEVVLFGGAGDGGTRLGDTWTWTLAGGWVEKQPVAAPSSRARQGLVADPVRGRLILHGGILSSTSPLAETWTWDGETWERVFAQVPPAPQSDPAIAYDAIGAQLIAIGPRGGYALQWTAGTPDEACATASDRDRDGLAGCADPDCWASCAPLCPIGTSCAGPRCGDTVCGPVETCRLCSADCLACTVLCGDGVCDAAEVCPGDCGP